MILTLLIFGAIIALVLTIWVCRIAYDGGRYDDDLERKWKEEKQ